MTVHGAASAGVATRDAALQEPGARERVDPGEDEQGEFVLQPLQRRVGREAAAGRPIGAGEGGEEAVVQSSDHPAARAAAARLFDNCQNVNTFDLSFEKCQ